MENGMMNGDHDRSRSPSPGISRSNSRNASSRDGNRTSLLRRNQSLSAKQIRFYRNGDRFFCGLKLAVSPERYKEFDALLAELSNKLELSTGAVRCIFNAETGEMITDVSQLQYGSSYVCSSSNIFKEVDAGYGNMKPSWSLAHHKKESAPTSSSAPVIEGTRDFIKPKLVTVIKNGKPPQKKVTMLLNAKTAVSLEQVLDHLSSKGTVGKVDKLHTVDGKQIKELRHLFGDDTMFVALSSNEKFPDEGFDVDVQSLRPPWRYSPVPQFPCYIPGLRPEPPPPEKKFSVHLHCILAASMSNLTTPRPIPIALRTRSVSPRPCSSRKAMSPSPKSAPRSFRNLESHRPKSAIGFPSEFSRKPLAPSHMEKNTLLKPVKKKAGSDKPIPIRPKAGSDVPVAIRTRSKPPEQKVLESSLQDETSDSEDSPGRHGYYVYVYNEKISRSQGFSEGKPTASVRPMMFSPESHGVGNAFAMDSTEKLDLKPMMLNITPADSLETVMA